MDASGILSQYGLPGLIIIVLATVNAVQYRDNKALQDKLLEAQQSRVGDAKEVQEKIIVPLELQSKIMDLIQRKLYDAKKDA